MDYNKIISKISNLLNKYTLTCIELEKIKNKIVTYRNETKEKLMSAKTDQEKKEIFLQFRKQIQNLKNDQEISIKYVNLKKQKSYLHEKIIDYFKKSIINLNTENDCENIVNNDLNFLLDKYSFINKNNINNDISEFSDMSISYLNDISSDFIDNDIPTDESTGSFIKTDSNIIISKLNSFGSNKDKINKKKTIKIYMD